MFNGYTHQYRHLLTRDLFQIYFLLGMRALGASMIGIFLPLYFFVELHFPLSAVIFFFLLLSLSFAVASYLGLLVISRYGAKHSILWSYFFLIISFLFLFFLPRYPFLSSVVALFMGIDLGLFWMGLHVDFALHSQKKNLGRASGVLEMVGVLGAILGPLLGGLVLKFFSFSALFVFSLLLLVTSVLPLLFSKDAYAKSRFDLRFLLRKEHFCYFLAYFAQGVRSTAGSVFWPLFIFSILGSYFVLGSYATLATLFVGLLGYLFGALSDRWGKRYLIRLFAPFEAVFWILRLFVQNALDVFSLGLLGNVSSSGIDIPLLAKSYGRAKKEEVAGFIFFRELSLRAGELTVLVLVLILGSLGSSFIASALSSLLYLFF